MLLLIPPLMLLSGVLVLYLYWYLSTRHMLQYSEKWPGPRRVPILGTDLGLGLKLEELWPLGLKILDEYGHRIRVWLFTELVIMVTDPKDIEIVLNSPKSTDKAFLYNFSKPWLGEGLLTNKGERWKSHRKLITPTFHFKILEQFVEVFNRNGNIFLNKLSSHVNGPEFEIYPYAALLALDNICETSMGVSVNAQNDNNSEYVQAVRSLGDIIFKRLCTPWLYPDIIFWWTSLGRNLKKAVTILHGTSTSIIKKRRLEMAKGCKKSDFQDDIGIKRRIAFLDMMIQASDNGADLTDEDIREEVDTILFGGYDTTSSGISFAMWLLSLHQDVQDRAVEEVNNVLGDSDREASYQDLQEMRYLEMVMKETLRLYPSVLMFGRCVTENLDLDGVTAPAGTNIGIVPFHVHRNPEYFPDPEKFDPDRFLPQNSAGRSPYCYIPFSAGSRNCIGQKFAMLEMKATLCKVLLRYRILPSDHTEELVFVPDLVLKPTNPLKLKLQLRT